MISGENVAEPDAIRVEGKGKFLIADLWDMHVHALANVPAGFGKRRFGRLVGNTEIDSSNLGPNFSNDGCPSTNPGTDRL